MFVFFSLQCILFLYLLFRLVLPLRVSRPVKIALGLILLVISQHYLIRLAFGYMASPEAPRWLILLEGWSFAALLLLFLLTLVHDLVILFRKTVARKAGSFSPERRAALFTVAAAGIAAYGVGKAAEVPQVRNTEVRLARLPAALDGLVVVQATDLHISPLFPERWVAELVERINALKPDLILLTGDLVDGTPGLRARDIVALRNLHARYGVHGCTGNHEYYGGYRSWMPVFASLGFNMLENRHVLLHINGAPLAVAGLTDVAAGAFGLPLPSVEAALSGTPPEAVRIVLDHRPGGAACNAAAGADLQLSGHTHGGHALGLNHIVAHFNAGYVYGWYTVDDMPLYVSSGAGLWNGFPVRLGVPSEIVRIVLRSV